MKHFLIPVLDIAFLYLFYRMLPWPTSVALLSTLLHRTILLTS